MCVCAYMCVYVYANICVRDCAHIGVGSILGVGFHFLSCLRQGLFLVVHSCAYQASRPLNFWGSS